MGHGLFPVRACALVPVYYIGNIAALADFHKDKVSVLPARDYFGAFLFLASSIDS